MKSKYVGWIIFILSFIGFLIIENLFTIKPHVTSGNGNLGLLVIIIFSPIFIANYILVFRLVKSSFSNKLTRKSMLIILCISFVILLVLGLLIFNYIKELIIALGGPPTNPESRIYRFGWFNQYTNSMYFNIYTFLFTNILVFNIGILASYIKNNKEKIRD